MGLLHNACISGHAAFPDRSTPPSAVDWNQMLGSPGPAQSSGKEALTGSEARLTEERKL